MKKKGLTIMITLVSLVAIAAMTTVSYAAWTGAKTKNANLTLGNVNIMSFDNATDIEVTGLVPCDQAADSLAAGAVTYKEITLTVASATEAYKITAKTNASVAGKTAVVVSDTQITVMPTFTVNYEAGTVTASDGKTVTVLTETAAEIVADGEVLTDGSTKSYYVYVILVSNDYADHAITDGKVIFELDKKTV